jgi:hypothetical protein
MKIWRACQRKQPEFETSRTKWWPGYSGFGIVLGYSLGDGRQIDAGGRWASDSCGRSWLYSLRHWLKRRC